MEDVYLNHESVKIINTDNKVKNNVANTKFRCNKCKIEYFYYNALKNPDDENFPESFYWKFLENSGKSIFEWEKLILSCEEEIIKKLIE